MKGNIKFKRKTEDPFQFLEKNTPRTEKWLKSEELKTHTYFLKNKYKKPLTNRIKSVVNIETKSVPIIKNGHTFFWWRKKNEEMGSIYIVRHGFKKPSVLLDSESLFKKNGHVLESWIPSNDGKRLAYSLSKSGNDKSSIYVLNVETGDVLKDHISEDSYPYFLCWNNESDGFWYMRSKRGTPDSEKKLNMKVYFHTLGDNSKNDLYFLGEDWEKADWPNMSISEDGRYFIVSVHNSSKENETTRIFLGKTRAGGGSAVEIFKKEECRVYAYIHRDFVYILTNKDAPNGKVEKVKIDDLENGDFSFKTIIKESRNKIESICLVQENIFVEILENVSSQLHAYSLSGKLKRKIALPSKGSISAIRCERESQDLFFSYSSYSFPETVFKLPINNVKPSIFFQDKLSFKCKEIEVKQVFFRSLDGTKVPMFIVHKKGMKMDGNNPTLAYGYGGFGISILPRFHPDILPFLEDGGVYAEINIRGGGEFGEGWHKSGTLLKKQNSFDDFVAGLYYLVKKKYTKHEKLAIFGWSNGGLLVGGVVAKHPRICGAAIIGAPVLDMARYHLFDGGKHWISDYGNPCNAKHLANLMKYSPYHNIKSGVIYPPILIITARKDDRVHPMHAYKFTAKINAEAKPPKFVLLRVEKNAGHGGANGVKKYIEQQADIWSFVYDCLTVE